MSVINAVYRGNLCVDCEHERTGEKIHVESLLDGYGLGNAFSPTDLVAAALGACSMNVIGIYCHARNMDADGATLRIVKTPAENPDRIGSIDVEITMPAKGYGAKDRKGIERCVKSCPVHNSLSDKLEQRYKFVWLDDAQ